MLITTQAQPPPFLTTSTGAVIKVKEKESGHKWLGCMLSSAGSKSATLDIDYHLKSANRAFFANKWIFLSRNVSIRNKLKLKFFDAIVTPIACFGAGPRCIHSADMDKFDIHSRRMIRCVVGAPGGFFFFFPRTFFLAQGLVGAVLLGSFQACAIYIPAAPDVQGNRAKSKPLLLRGGLGRGWRLGGGWPQPAPHW